METEIAKRVGAGWMNWKKCSGVLCDKRMPVKLKGKVYRTVVRPAMLYGAETWATTKRQESRIEVNEMRMLRWMCGVTRKDKIRNEHIRGTTKVVQASRKITERRLKWYGHVMRMEEDHVVRRVMTKAIPGERKSHPPPPPRQSLLFDIIPHSSQPSSLRSSSLPSPLFTYYHYHRPPSYVCSSLHMTCPYHFNLLSWK